MVTARFLSNATGYSSSNATETKDELERAGILRVTNKRRRTLIQQVTVIDDSFYSIHTLLSVGDLTTEQLAGSNHYH